MRLRALVFFILTLAFVSAACITESRPVILISLDPDPPDTVFGGELIVSGLVVRAPPDPNALFTVTAVRTAGALADTTEVLAESVGNFSIRVPIAQDTLGIVNTITISATDEQEASISDEARFSVIGLLEAPAFRRENE